MSEANTGADLRKEVTVPLAFPISVDGKTYNELTLRRPKVSDNKWIERKPGSDLDKTILIAARLCDVTPEAIEELDEFDLIALSEQMARFRGQSITDR